MRVGVWEPGTVFCEAMPEFKPPRMPSSELWSYLQARGIINWRVSTQRGFVRPRNTDRWPEEYDLIIYESIEEVRAMCAEFAILMSSE